MWPLEDPAWTNRPEWISDQLSKGWGRGVSGKKLAPSHAHQSCSAVLFKNQQRSFCSELLGAGAGSKGLQSGCLSSLFLVLVVLSYVSSCFCLLLCYLHLFLCPLSLSLHCFIRVIWTH